MSIAIVILVVCADAAVAYIVWIRRRLRERRSFEVEPVCGHCGYSAFGLEQMICPECGSDHREVGIVPQGYRHSRRIAGAISMLVVTVYITGFVVNGVLPRIMPTRLDYVSTISFSRPRPGALRAVIVSATGSSWTGNDVILPVTVQMTNAKGEPATLHADVPGRVLRWADPAGHEVELKSRVTTDAVLKWLGSAGIDNADLRVIDDAREIAIAIQVAARQEPLVSRLGASITRGFMTSGTLTRRVTPKTLVWIDPIMRWFWWVLAGIGVLYIVLASRGRRLERTSSAMNATA